MTQTILGRLQEHAHARGEATAMNVWRNEAWNPVTYHQLWERVRAAAVALQEDGLMSGQRVILWADNSPEWAISYLAVHAAGGVVMPLDAQYSAADAAALLRFATPEFAITDDAHRERLWQARQDAEVELHIWTLDYDAPDSLTNVRHVPSTVPDADPDAPLAILFTSGTTGTPKGVQLSAANIVSNIEGGVRRLSVTTEDNVLLLLPLHHAFPCTCALLLPLYVGGTVTFSPSLKGPDILRALQETRVSVMAAVPQLMSLLDRGLAAKVQQSALPARLIFNTLLGLSGRLRRWTGWRAGRVLLGRVHRNFGDRFRCFVSGGAKLDAELHERFADLGFLVLQGYGLTETSPIVAVTPPSRPKFGSVGPPLDNVEVTLHEPNDKGVGELVVKGPNVMQGYFLNEDATQQVLRDDGFFTGDLAYIDDDGDIHITGRAKEVIVLPSGKNIYPEEVEKQYEQVEGVKEICVLDSAGEGLAAAVVPERQAQFGTTNVRDRLQHGLRMHGVNLPSYWRINKLTLLSRELPRTRLGKIQRKKVEQMVEQVERGERPAEREVDPETAALMQKPVVQQFLRDLSMLTAQPREFAPHEDLGVDVGIDSLTQVQLVSMLEDDYQIPDAENRLADADTVADLARVVADESKVSAETAGASGRSWSEQLRQPPRRTLEEQFYTPWWSPGRLAFSLIVVMCRIIARLIWGARLRGAHRIPPGRVLLCPNHVSLLDAPILFLLLPSRVLRRTMFVADAGWFGKPPTSWVIRWARIALTGQRGDYGEAMRLTFKGLQRDMAVVLFPEGARSPGGELLPARPGAGILSCEADAPIVPLLMEGTERTLSPRYPGIHFPKIRVTVGRPIQPPSGDACSAENYATMTAEWTKALEQMQQQRRKKRQ